MRVHKSSKVWYSCKDSSKTNTYIEWVLKSMKGRMENIYHKCINKENKLRLRSLRDPNVRGEMGHVSFVYYWYPSKTAIIVIFFIFNPLTQIISIHMCPKSTKQCFFLGTRNYCDILKLSFAISTLFWALSCGDGSRHFVPIESTGVWKWELLFCAFAVRGGHCCLGNLSLGGTKAVYSVGGYLT